MSSQSQLTLSAADYAVFGVTLGISAAIGVFYAIKDRRSDEGTEGYLLGGRSMSMLPVSLSLSVSFMSAVTVLGTPAEVYRYGTMYGWFLIALLIVTIVTAEVYIPMFFRMKITSVYEYIEKRYNRPVRILATIMYFVSNVIYIGIVIYAPSLALSAVTGFNLWAAVSSTGLVCVFYTTLGGFKAVIWTDVFQAIVMLMGFLAITIRGSMDQGGYARVWEVCEEGGRIDFLRIDPDPRYRHTVWSILLGGTFLWLRQYASGQSQVQRFLSCKSVTQAKGAVYLNWIGLVVIISLSMINGTIIYAFYRGCDPLENGEISAYDQLLPYLSLELFQNNPGVSGLVVSGIFSGSLSTVSTGINSMAGVTVQDYLRPYTNWSENKYTWFTKGAVAVFGAVCIGMAFLASLLGSVLQAALSISGLVGGPLFALFALGFMFPFVNSLGAFVGAVSGVAFTLWIYIGSLIYPAAPVFLRRLPLSTDQCVTGILNTTTSTLLTPEEPIIPSYLTYPAVADLYAISYIYYSFVGFWTAVIVAVILSLLSGGWKGRKNIDPSLFYFFFDHWSLAWLPNSFRRCMRYGIEVDSTKSKMEIIETIRLELNNESNPPVLNGASNKAYNVDLQDEAYDKELSSKL